MPGGTRGGEPAHGIQWQEKKLHANSLDPMEPRDPNPPGRLGGGFPCRTSLPAAVFNARSKSEALANLPKEFKENFVLVTGMKTGRADSERSFQSQQPATPREPRVISHDGAAKFILTNAPSSPRIEFACEGKDGRGYRFGTLDWEGGAAKADANNYRTSIDLQWNQGTDTLDDLILMALARELRSDPFFTDPVTALGSQIRNAFDLTGSQMVSLRENAYETFVRSVYPHFSPAVFGDRARVCAYLERRALAALAAP